VFNLASLSKTPDVFNLASLSKTPDVFNLASLSKTPDVFNLVKLGKRHNKIKFNIHTNTVLTGDEIHVLFSFPALTIDKLTYKINDASMINPLNIIKHD
jgi:hypothetical protein